MARKHPLRRRWKAPPPLGEKKRRWAELAIRRRHQLEGQWAAEDAALGQQQSTDGADGDGNLAEVKEEEPELPPDHYDDAITEARQEVDKLNSKKHKLFALLKSQLAKDAKTKQEERRNSVEEGAVTGPSHPPHRVYMGSATGGHGPEHLRARQQRAEAAAAAEGGSSYPPARGGPSFTSPPPMQHPHHHSGPPSHPSSVGGSGSGGGGGGGYHGRSGGDDRYRPSMMSSHHGGYGGRGGDYGPPPGDMRRGGPGSGGWGGSQSRGSSRGRYWDNGNAGPRDSGARYHDGPPHARMNWRSRSPPRGNGGGDGWSSRGGGGRYGPGPGQAGNGPPPPPRRDHERPPPHGERPANRRRYNDWRG